MAMLDLGRILPSIVPPAATNMTATLSPTRSAIPMASKSPSSSSKNGGNNGKLSAAADLIRNLDAALVEMTNSAAKSADDAARARRNAKTAGEVRKHENAIHNCFCLFVSAVKVILTRKKYQICHTYIVYHIIIIGGTTIRKEKQFIR